MAVKTIQIADKPTLDATKALLENGEYGLSAIKNAVDSGLSGGSVGGLQIEKYTDEHVNGCVSVSTLPYDFLVGSAVVLNGEIHILGGNYNMTYMKYHYKYNGSSWKRVSTLPYNFYGGSAVVLNGEIHILGGGEPSCQKNHYKYNGSSWKSVSTLPYNFDGGSAVVLNGEIHILGGIDHETSHYKHNGSWNSVYALLYGFHGSSAVVLDNDIHILGGTGHETSHYIVKNDSRHIATMLPKGIRIMLSDNENINYVGNATKISSNIAEVSETGYVEILATLPEPDDIKGYLIFY